MRTAIIGAGISGLSIARMLKSEGVDVTVFEREHKVGGMIKCQRICGSLFHQTGGHVFNTRYQDVAEWFWSHFDKDNEFTKATRNSAIIIGRKTVSYPIENHIYQLEDNLQKEIISSLLRLQNESRTEPENFEEFLKRRFGSKLYEIYFQPYNYKIWRKSLDTVPLEWLEGKLPMPTLDEILFNNFNHVKEKSFVHSTFYYPLDGGSQFIADRLAEGLDIRFGEEIDSIVKTVDGWIIGNEEFKKVIFCGNIKQLPSLLDQSVLHAGYAQSIEKLEAHGTTAVFCSIDKNDLSWIYLPDKNHESHRIICTGNFSPNNNNGETLTSSIEFTGYISKDDILKNLEKIPYSPKYIHHHYEKYTYPIQNQSTRETISSIKSILEKQDMYLLGRFAEWEYYNMDVAMHAAMELKSRIL